MRSLYWKIFLYFWPATILIILSTAWVTSEIAQKSSIPSREHVFMDSYANAAVATYESGKYIALKQWLDQTGHSKKMDFYLLSTTGEIIGNKNPPEEIKIIAKDLANKNLANGIIKFGDLIISHEIHSASGKVYRLAALSETPLHHFVAITWAGLTIRLGIATIISGLLCYLLSLYLTHPLRSLKNAAKSIGKGKLNTRVGYFKGHKHDEIAELSMEFDRMAEQLQTMVRSKEQLLQDISHELRSPLARLQVAIELGRKKSDLAESQFSRMEKECERLNTLIGEILQFSRLEKSHAVLNKSKVNITTLLKEIIADANFEYGESKPRVFLDKSSNYFLNIDKALIHSAIENIIRNALSYSPEDTLVRVSIDLDKASKKLYVDICDQGPGVPEKQLEKIFNPFYRVDKSREKSTGGYGLGLAIAEKAIALHEGSIEAMNIKEGGLQVRITIKVNASEISENIRKT
jgi:two-component system sensor histidine kinase CpxA